MEIGRTICIISLLVISSESALLSGSCGYRASWGFQPGQTNDATINYEEPTDGDIGGQSSFKPGYKLVRGQNLDLASGIFTADEDREYLVTATAFVINNSNELKTVSYAQIFLLKNGALESLDDYLLVEENKASDMKIKKYLKKGDTLELYVGHHLNRKFKLGLISYDGFNMEDIRFCVF